MIYMSSETPERTPSSGPPLRISGGYPFFLSARVSDLAGRSVEYAYDGNGNLEKATLFTAGADPQTQTLATYGYNDRHGLTIESNAMGESWRIGYGQPDRGVASRITNPAGKSLALKADFESRIFRLTDYGGVTRRFILDSNGEVVSDAEIKDGVAIPRVTVQYQPDGSKKSIDAQGQSTYEERDLWGNVTKRERKRGRPLKVEIMRGEGWDGSSATR